ncbi:MAG: DUF4870 domain-containing protein [Dysgonamonadaceae bacterium]|nr:DUF4870 domain-containing protein [Dysgonamonadaceae bacterium]
MKYEDLKLLDELREKGSITEEEYQREKAKILNGTPPPPPNSSSLGINENLYAVLMHLSQFASYIIIPLVMWIIGKDSSEKIDQHGKNIINFTISYFIYMLILIPLIILLIGIPLLIILVILIPIFIIIATIKAANGEAWKYPLSIEFIK